VVVLGGHRLGYLGFFAAALVVTAPLAWLSWKLVERPSLRFKIARLNRSHATRAKIGELQAGRRTQVRARVLTCNQVNSWAMPPRKRSKTFDLQEALAH
jgi:peptidoglycan/LPS O-acetylase OafA/YrhL